MVLLIELEIPRLSVGVTVHRRLNFDRLAVPHAVTPTGPLEIDAVLLGNLVLNQRTVSVRSVRSAHWCSSRVLDISAGPPRRIVLTQPIAKEGPQGRPLWAGPGCVRARTVTELHAVMRKPPLQCPQRPDTECRLRSRSKRD